MLEKYGVIHGRFQPLHHGHMEYLLAGKSRCEFLFIGITNPDPALTSENTTHPSRSLPLSNPFTYFERLLMLRDALVENGVKREEFEVVPFPINYPNLIRYYVPMDALFFVTVYDEWGWDKVRVLQSLNVRFDIMWERDMSERFTTGTEVRNLIVANEKWEHLVPKAVEAVIKGKHLDKRLRETVRDVT